MTLNIENIIRTFEKASKHIASSDIIKKYSTNKEDIREFAVSNIDLKGVRNVLDLGCGFGFISGIISERIARNASFVGIDACAENSDSFLNSVNRKFADPEFCHFQICDKLPYEDNSFDLIIASYSLYFFVEILPEIARTLRPDGIFITITHFENSLSELFTASGMSGKYNPITNIIKRFSAENGQAILSSCFTDIEKLEYINELYFRKENVNDLLEYTRFKIPLIFQDSDSSEKEIEDTLVSVMEKNMQETLMNQGYIKINKSDAVFRCRGPVCR